MQWMQAGSTSHFSSRPSEFRNFAPRRIRILSCNCYELEKYLHFWWRKLCFFLFQTMRNIIYFCFIPPLYNILGSEYSIILKKQVMSWQINNIPRHIVCVSMFNWRNQPNFLSFTTTKTLYIFIPLLVYVKLKLRLKNLLQFSQHSI